MKAIIQSKFVLPLAFAASLAACSGSPEEGSATTGVDTTTVVADTVNAMTEYKYQKLVADIPMGGNLTAGLKESGIAYNKAFLNNPENTSKYQTSFKKALNYGVYGADFAYTVAYGKTLDAFDYFTASRGLADQLGSAQIFEEFAKGSAIEKANFSQEKMDESLNMMFDAMDKYLVSNKRLEEATVITVGAWMESQYILLEMLKDKAANDKTAPLFERLWQQKLHINNIKGLMAEFPNNADITALQTDLNAYFAAYEKFSKPEDITPAAVKDLEGLMNAARTKAIQ